MRRPRTASGRGLDRPPGVWVVPEQRRRPSPRPPETRICDDPDIRVHSIIYAWLIYEIDPRTGRLLAPDPITGERRTRLDYVGQTIRALETRAGEHLEDKPWADIVVGRLPIKVAEGLWTKEERDKAEIEAIGRIRPRYNYRDNLDNPERIELFRQLDQRHVRDRAAGRPLWLPLEERSVAAQIAAEKALVQAGLNGHEPRYPVAVAGALLAAAGRFWWRLSRRTKLALMTPPVWLAAVWMSTGWLTAMGWPRNLALAGTLTLFTAATAGLLRTKPLRRWVRRRRR